MPCEVSWYHPEKIVYFRVFDVLTVEQLAQASAIIGDNVMTGAAPVHLIVDVVNMKSIPTNVLEIKKLNEYLGDERMGWLIVVGANHLVTMIATVISQLAKTRYRNFKSLEPALMFLASQDETLGDLLEQEAGL